MRGGKIQLELATDRARALACWKQQSQASACGHVQRDTRDSRDHVKLELDVGLDFQSVPVLPVMISLISLLAVALRSSKLFDTQQLLAIQNRQIRLKLC